MNEALQKYNMTNVNTKTIVITAIPGKRPISAIVQRPVQTLSPTATLLDLDMDDDDDDYAEYTENGTRKRKRLTHLSPDQRMMRRKLKNRVAAQTARDRKKMRMQDLEEAVAALEAENKRLQRENSTLKLQTGALSQQNIELRGKLEQDDVMICEDAPTDQDGSLKSAAGEDPSCLSGRFTVSNTSSNTQPDLMGLLQQIVDSSETDESEEIVPAGIVQALVAHSCPVETPEVVGPSTAELESIKELIHFDHEYYKSAPCPSPQNVHLQSSVLTEESNECTQVPDISLVKSEEPCITTESVLEQVVTDLSETQTDIEPLNMSQMDLASFLEENMDSFMELEALLVEEKGQTESDISVDSEDKTCTYNSSSTSFLDEEYIRLSPTQCLTEPQPNKVSSGSLSDSGYTSEHSNIGSPASDTSAWFGDHDSLWEESFTELFPSLA